MIRKHENAVSWKAGGLAIAVHAVLLSALLISFNWKAAHPVMNVTEVELWDKMPNSPAPKVEPPPPPQPEPLPKVEEPKPEPPKPVVEDKPAPDEAEIALKKEEKKKQQEAEKKLEEKKLEDKKLEAKKLEEKRKEVATKKLQAALREEDLQDKKSAQDEKDKLRKIKAAMEAEDKAESSQQASAATASVIGEYTDKIKAKIRGNVNKTLCGDGNPELKFEIGLLPTGELTGTPKIIKHSKIEACDEAVERAIIASEPLPMPKDPAALAKFRQLTLTFRPNDN